MQEFLITLMKKQYWMWICHIMICNILIIIIVVSSAFPMTTYQVNRTGAAPDLMEMYIAPSAQKRYLQEYNAFYWLSMLLYFLSNVLINSTLVYGFVSFFWFIITIIVTIVAPSGNDVHPFMVFIHIITCQDTSVLSVKRQTNHPVTLLYPVWEHSANRGQYLAVLPDEKICEATAMSSSYFLAAFDLLSVFKIQLTKCVCCMYDKLNTTQLIYCCAHWLDKWHVSVDEKPALVQQL